MTTGTPTIAADAPPASRSDERERSRRARDAAPEAPSDRSSQTRRAAFALVALVVALYWPTVNFGFVNWDDRWYVVENPVVRSWQPASLWSLATEVHVKNYAPLTLASHLIEHTLWGLWPGGYHLTNLLLHALNAVLVWVLVRQVTGSRFIAWTTAALFAVHPVQVETVAWISSRKGLLSATFILACLIRQLRPERSSRDEGIALMFLAAALLTKAIAIVVPAVVLAYDLIVRKRPFAEALPRQIVPGVLCLCLLAITAGAQTSELGGLRDHLELSRGRILAVDAIVLWKYVGMLAWPANLAVLYDVPTAGIAGWAALAITGWATVAWGMYRLRTRSPLIPFAGTAALLFLLPVLNLIPITTLMNDRYLYLPSIAVFGLFAALGRHMSRLCEGRGDEVRSAECEMRNIEWRSRRVETQGASLPRGTRLARLTTHVAIGTAIVACAVATHRHLPVWRDSVSLWRHTARVSPGLAVVQYQLADALFARGETDEAVAALERALADCDPDDLDRERIERRLAARK
ncbi:MAG: tetratricopeptide repeat protein [Planctomycetaceae bacterium]